MNYKSFILLSLFCGSAMSVLNNQKNFIMMGSGTSVSKDYLVMTNIISTGINGLDYIIVLMELWNMVKEKKYSRII